GDLERLHDVDQVLGLLHALLAQWPDPVVALPVAATPGFRVAYEKESWQWLRDPLAEALAVERLPHLRPLRARVLRRQVLHRDQLAGDECTSTRYPHGAQPRLRRDAVLVLAEDGLQLGRRPR